MGYLPIDQSLSSSDASISLIALVIFSGCCDGYFSRILPDLFLSPMEEPGCTLVLRVIFLVFISMKVAVGALS
jgi:hypothetical protein